ncbi:hypothetical protein [Galactobacillus timonensis]|uniref:hypothetical protein n=1 Tax=Galactobacillus timonensis TaxID=2041840 RepID=UPI000C82180B|nr:hypothetical protein [Galactobacillus timonensis]
MEIRKVLKDPAEMGEMWLTRVRGVYSYENGSRTDKVIGYKYTIVFIDQDGDAADFKILGEKQMENPDGHVEVELIEPEWVPYTMNNRVQLAARAKGIRPVKG